jgi:hypothetical protein
MSKREPHHPSLKAKAHARRAFFETLDATLSAARPAVPVAVAAPSPGLSFEAWAELSVCVLELPEEALEKALVARGLTLAAWKQLDRAYYDALADDLRAGRQERPALYAAKYKEERARRAGAAVETAPAPPPSAPADLRDTKDVPDLPALMLKAIGGMPFVAPAPVAPERRSVKTVQSTAVPSTVGGATLDLNAALARPAPSVPFAGSTGGAGVVYVPQLSARQYVALRAELMLAPAAPEETRRRYQVTNEAALRALEEHWREPARRAELEVALVDFAAALRGQVLR